MSLSDTIASICDTDRSYLAYLRPSKCLFCRLSKQTEKHCMYTWICNMLWMNKENNTDGPKISGEAWEVFLGPVTVTVTLDFCLAMCYSN